METQINWTALGVFIFFFVLVTVMGFAASRWQSGGAHKGAHLDEWGLGGRNFGTWITWFLVGGDFYTAYRVIAVPALVYAVGAYTGRSGLAPNPKIFNHVDFHLLWACLLAKCGLA